MSYPKISKLSSKALLYIIFFILLIPLFYSQNCDDSQTIFKISSTTNAHAELWDQINYQTKICWSTSGTHECTGNNLILRLSSQINAHAQTKDYIGTPYSIDVCFGDLECISTEAGICDSDYTEIARLSSETNAHVSLDGSYTTLICCKGTGQQPTCDDDGTCDHGETNTNCPNDCPIVCGDGTCDSTETLDICPEDCYCGNNYIDPGEVCDGTDLGRLIGLTCEDLEFTSNPTQQLICSSNCLGLDTSVCSDCNSPEAVQVCADINSGRLDCTSITANWIGDLTCDSSCNVLFDDCRPRTEDDECNLPCNADDDCPAIDPSLANEWEYRCDAGNDCCYVYPKDTSDECTSCSYEVTSVGSCAEGQQVVTLTSTDPTCCGEQTRQYTISCASPPEVPFFTTFNLILTLVILISYYYFRKNS